jgi:hypothetical protein
MDLDLILLLISVFVLGCYIGWKVQEKLMFMTMMDMFAQAGVTHKDLDKFVGHWKKEFDAEDEVEDDERDTVEIKVEQHGAELYAFRKDNQEFIGQGNSKESLITRLGETMTGKKLLISEGDGAELIGGDFTVTNDGKIVSK